MISNLLSQQPPPSGGGGGGAAAIIDAIVRLLDVLIRNFGQVGTLIIALAIVALASLWRVYNDRRKDKEVNAVIAEKDKTIQRLAEQERNYRILFFKEKAGWTDEEIDRFVMKNDFDGVVSARKALEEAPRPESDERHRSESPRKATAPGRKKNR